MSRPIRVTFVPTGPAGVIFYRAKQMADALKSAGVDAKCLWYQPGKWKRNNTTLDFTNSHPWEFMLYRDQIGVHIQATLELAVRNSDVVVWLSLHTYESLRMYMYLRSRYAGRLFLSDFDDCMFNTPAYLECNKAYKPGSYYSTVSVRQIENTDGIVVTTPYLANIMRKYHGKVHIVPNCINFPLWVRSQRPKDEGAPVSPDQRVIIGWMGSNSHYADLDMVQKPLFRVLEKYKQAVFRCVHCIPESFKGHKQVEWVSGFKPINQYPKFIVKQRFDIGIAPLVNNAFTESKSNLRWLEYSAMGIPCVATPASHFKQTIKHGASGYLAETEDQWVEYLGKLIESKDLREFIGRQAYEEASTRWSLEAIGKKYKSLLEELLYAQSDPEYPGCADRGLDRRPEQHAMVGV